MNDKWFRRNAFLVVSVLATLGCYPLGIDDVSETDIVITRKAPDYDYSKNRTYDMPDVVADLCEFDPDALPGAAGGGGGPPVDIGDLIDCDSPTKVYDSEILDAVHRNMQALGYERATEESGEEPDVLVLVGALTADNWIVYQSYPWYWYYPDYYYWYDWYYGWWTYYPYYPPTTVVNYETGSIIIDMVSLKDADPINERIPSIWIGAVNGMLDSSAVATTRINDTIDQAFAQSPYLKAGTP